MRKELFMFAKKRKCINPYITIMILTMAAVGVVSIVDKGRCICTEKMDMLKEKMPVMFSKNAGEN